MIATMMTVMIMMIIVTTRTHYLGLLQAWATETEAASAVVMEACMGRAPSYPLACC